MMFSTQLRNLRKSKKITQEEFAEKFDVSRQAVAKWESGESIPDIYRLLEIARFFEMTVEELVKGKRKETANEVAKEIYNKFVENIEAFSISTNYSYDKNLAKELIILINQSIFVLPKDLVDQLYEVGCRFGTQPDKVVKRYRKILNNEELSYYHNGDMELVIRHMYLEINDILKDYLK